MDSDSRMDNHFGSLNHKAVVQIHQRALIFFPAICCLVQFLSLLSVIKTSFTEIVFPAIVTTKPIELAASSRL